MPVKEKQSPADSPCNALVTLGTYHGVMAGLVLKKDKFFLKFSIKRHVGCVNGVNVREKYIASCGVDERVFIFTNKAEHKSAVVRQKLRELGEPTALRLADLGSLTPPAEVTQLLFCGKSGGQETASFLLCGTLEGQLLLYRTRDWSLHNALSVHERGVVALATHPLSGGMLVVSVASDRSVAVIDLTKGKLLTKWKYNSQPPPTEAEEKTEEGEEGPPLKKRKLPLAGPREEPLGVLYSPKGEHLILFARFSFIVYDGQSMKPVFYFKFDKPKPTEELHCAVVVGPTNLLLGNESGSILRFDLSSLEEQSLTPVAVHYPDEVKAAAEQLLSTPVNVSVETKEKHPLRHTARVKCLSMVKKVLFSVDSNGVVMAWKMTFQDNALVSLNYITSANCRGRVTSMDVLEL